MIRYDLKCADGHDFEAWFASSSAYDKLAAAGMVTCSLCGSDKVEKALMAPRVPKKGNSKTEQPAPAPQPEPEPVLTAPVGAEVEKRLAALRAEVEKNSDYVGDKFAAEARKMHVGDSEARAIHGEATLADAKSLIEDGVPVAPLPFAPKRNS
ncbi:MAG: DUF1178 family protein [Pikeienuella sp.]